MQRFDSTSGSAGAMCRVAALLLCAAVLAQASGCQQLSLTALLQARRLSADLLVRFTREGQAADRAVMADTDEASVAFAREARAQTQAIERESGELGSLLRNLDYSQESALLRKFRDAFTKYRRLDEEILGLAIENTNLKAQRLSFGAVSDAGNALRDALDQAVRGVSATDACRAQALAATSLSAVREIQVLEAPHIAAAENSVMDALERQMAASDHSARDALDQLRALVPAARRSLIDSTSAALDRFRAVHAQVLVLSRRNSNVRSLALSLGDKRVLAAVCEASLRGLRERLEHRGWAGTR